MTHVHLYVRLALKASETSAFHLRVGNGTERNHPNLFQSFLDGRPWELRTTVI
jgi:hypothetical protein